MRYISEDGKVFNTEMECLDHEKVLKAEEDKKNKAAKEKEERYQALVDKQNKIIAEEKEFAAMQKSYLEDYRNVKVGELGDLLDVFGIADFAFPFILFRK